MDSRLRLNAFNDKKSINVEWVSNIFALEPEMKMNDFDSIFCQK